MSTLTGQTISSTYGKLVQFATGVFYDGLGNSVPVATTGSNVFKSNQTVSGSVTVTSGISSSGFVIDQTSYLTRNINRISSIGGDHSIVIAPSGSGYISVQVPDGTTVGGNARGDNSVDLQMTRNAADQVASGTNSFVVGYRNKATGLRAIAIGSQCQATNTNDFAAGSSCVASGQNSTAFGEGSEATGYNSFCHGNYSLASGPYSICLGAQSTSTQNSTFVVAESSNATAQYACVFGGDQHNARHQYSSVFGGRGNTASASYATVCGGQDNLASGQYSLATGYGVIAPSTFMRAHGFQGNGSTGGFQTVDVGLFNQTTDATPTRLYVNGSAENYVVPANSIVQMTIKIQSTRNTAGAEFAAWERKVTFKRGVAVSTVALVGSVQVVGTDVGSNGGIPPAAWSIAITADTGTGAINITVTGEAAKTIRWTAVLDAVELVFA